MKGRRKEQASLEWTGQSWGLLGLSDHPHALANSSFPRAWLYNRGWWWPCRVSALFSGLVAHHTLMEMNNGGRGSEASRLDNEIVPWLDPRQLCLNKQIHGTSQKPFFPHSPNPLFNFVLFWKVGHIPCTVLVPRWPVCVSSGKEGQ